MKKWFKVIDVNRCHDCNNCFMADKDEFVDNDWPGYAAPQPRHGQRWVDILRRERGQYARNDVAYLPVPCQHCQNPPCVTADGAVYAREDGIVIIDPVKAKGKPEIVDTCPYGAIFWNEELQLAQKCIFCAHLLDDPTWKPHTTRCAHACPTDAMKTYFVEPAEMDKMIAAEDLMAYKAELGTKPSTLYKNLYKFTKNFITAGVLVDGDCFEGADVTLHSKDGRHRVQPVRGRRGQLQRHLRSRASDHELLRGVQVRRPGERRVHHRCGRQRQEVLRERDHQG